MNIVKNQFVFIPVLTFLLLNITDAFGCQFEPAFWWYSDKVHEFLSYYGVQNAYDVPVYTMDSRGQKGDVIVKYGLCGGIWIDENIRMHSQNIKTEQDVIWYLAAAAAQYVFMKKIVLRFGFLSILSTLPIVVNNALLAWLNGRMWAQNCSLVSKLLIGLITNIGAIVGTIKLHEYFMKKDLSPRAHDCRQEIYLNVLEVLYKHGYPDAGQAFFENLEKILAPKNNKVCAPDSSAAQASK